VKQLGHPLLTTTLPQEGLAVEEYTDPSLILDRYEKQVDLVLDGGYGGHFPSSVLEITDEFIEIIRLGAGDVSDFE
jgi:tRNA A37 threonylcarbamoyladenosine synthetase subunit TsaC/SUA5/YrdC